VRVRGRRYTPAEIVALIVRDLKASAEKALGEIATHAVIAVPSFFNEVQRQAVRQAAALAGLDLLRLVNDPTAAALAHASGRARGAREEERVVVYDLGGGTFDISLLSLKGDEVEVKAVWGDAFLGGEDFDQRIAVHLADAFHAQHGLDLRNDETGMHQLRRLATAAKHALSEAEMTDVSLPMTGPRLAAAAGATPGAAAPPPVPGSVARRPPRRRTGTPQALTVTLTRGELESLTRDLVDRTLFPCEAALQDADWTASEVDTLVVSGAQGRMPRVRELLAEVFGKRSVALAHGDGTVAVGAAILGERLRASSEAVGVVERVAVSLGVETAGGVCTRLIPKGTPLPASRTQAFSPPSPSQSDDQQEIVIHVVQGEREMAADNKSLGRYRIGPLIATRGVPHVEVQISIDESGLVSVAANNVQTGQRQDVTVSETTWQGG
jgi:molecular chaperone DnaK